MTRSLAARALRAFPCRRAEILEAHRHRRALHARALRLAELEAALLHAEFHTEARRITFALMMLHVGAR